MTYSHEVEHMCVVKKGPKRMMFAVITMVITADSKEQLEIGRASCRERV